MGRLFPLKKKKNERYGLPQLAMTLAALAVLALIAWLGDGGKGAKWWYLAGVVWSMGAMFFAAANVGHENCLLADTWGERTLKLLCTLLGAAGYALGFCYHLYYLAFLYRDPWLEWRETDEHTFLTLGQIWQENPLAAILVVAAGLIFLACLGKVLADVARGRAALWRGRAHAVKVEGPDGKSYRMPGDLRTALALYGHVAEEDSIPFRLYQERTADLMYEDFKKDGWYLEKPEDMEESRFQETKKFLWTQRVAVLYAKAVQFRLLDHQQVDKARQDVDRLVEIAMVRNVKDDGVTTRHLALELRRLVYASVPASQKDPAAEAKYDRMWRQEQGDYTAYQAEAPARQAAREEWQRQEERRQRELAAEQARRQEELARRAQARAEKEARLRAEYDAKVRGLDDRERTLNAFLDKNTYTNEENYLAGNLGEQEYARRKFLRDEKEDKYRREYEEALQNLDLEDEDDE